MNLHVIVPALFIPLAGWKMYSRYRSSVGRQQFRPKRLWVSAVLFPLLFLSLAGLNLENTAAATGLFAGAGLGICLALLGLRLTTLESSETGMFYKPNPYLGTGLMLVLAARITYRFIQLSSERFDTDPAGAVRTSPLTFLMIGAVAWYFGLYAAGLLYRRRKLTSVSPRQ